MKTGAATVVAAVPSPRPTPAKALRRGAWLAALAPDLKLLAFVLGSLLALGFLIGFDLPGR